MSQVFSATGKVTAAPVALVDAVDTSILESDTLVVPFQTARAIIHAVAMCSADANATMIELTLWRNFASDHVQVGSAFIAFPAGDFPSLPIPIAGIDNIPSGRDLKYSLRATITGDAGGVVNAVIDALLVSG